MSQTTREMLEEQIKIELEKISLMEDGSEEKAKAIEGLDKLYKLKMAEIELDDKMVKEEDDKKERALDRKIKIGLETAGIVVPTVFSAIFLRKGFKFEETGVLSSTTMRGLFNKVFKSLK